MLVIEYELSSIKHSYLICIKIKLTNFIVEGKVVRIIKLHHPGVSSGTVEVLFPYVARSPTFFRFVPLVASLVLLLGLRNEFYSSITASRLSLGIFPATTLTTATTSATPKCPESRWSAIRRLDTSSSCSKEDSIRSRSGFQTCRPGGNF